MDGVCSEGRLVEVNNWVLADDDVSQAHGKFNSPCFKESEVVTVGEVFLLGLTTLYIVSLVE